MVPMYSTRTRNLVARGAAALALIVACHVILSFMTTETATFTMTGLYSQDRESKMSIARPQTWYSDGMSADAELSSIDSTSKSNINMKNEQLEMALETVLILRPNDRTIHSLLEPIRETGGKRLYEMGVRTRLYKIYFEAWSRLHLVSSKGNLYIRDDIIQYLKGHPDYVRTLNSSLATTIHHYEAYHSFIDSFASFLFPWTAPFFPNHMALWKKFYSGERGIVMTGGNDQAPYLLTNIASLRKLGCTLPIEVMYLGDDDLNNSWRAELESVEGVLTRDLSSMIMNKEWELKGFAAKPFAILFSTFREVVFIDADALFLKNPAILFDDAGYSQTGALFFHDRLTFPGSKQDFLNEILQKPISDKVKASRYWTGKSTHEQESGVVVVDKWQHVIPLLLTTRMNGPDRDGNSEKEVVGIYDLMYGDKETFWLSWELSGSQDYEFHSGRCGTMGKLRTPEQTSDSTTIKPEATEHTICGLQLLHSDREGNPLWFNSWITSNKHDKFEDQIVPDFDVYVSEQWERDYMPTGEGQKEPWQWQGNNVACLTANYSTEFTVKEKQVLAMIVREAKRVGAVRSDA